MFKCGEVSIDFLINTTIPENCYLLGIMWADSCLHFNGYSRCLTYECTESDFVQLEFLFKKFGIINFIVRQRKKNGKIFGRPTKRFSYSNNITTDWLDEMGFYNKSKIAPTKLLENIPEKFHFHFWRGYFDGDGCLYLKNKRELAFWGNKEQDWSETTKLFDKLNINPYKIIFHNRRNGKHCSSFIKVHFVESIKRFCDYIYQDGYQCGFLNRKYEKYFILKEMVLNKTKRFYQLSKDYNDKL